MEWGRLEPARDFSPACPGRTERPPQTKSLPRRNAARNEIGRRYLKKFRGVPRSKS